MGEFSRVGTKAVFLHRPEDVSASPVSSSDVSHPTGSAHRRSLTSNPCFFSSKPFNFHNSSHFSALTLVSADRPIDLRKSSTEPMAPGQFRIGGGRARQQTRGKGWDLVTYLEEGV